MTNTQTKAKQQENNLVANKASNSQQQKEITGNGQVREKVEEPKSARRGQQDL